MEFKTEQEDFWSGEFGNQYAERNCSNQLIASSIHAFAQILSQTNNVDSILELGANIGMNLIALKQLLPEAKLTAVEINKSACEELSKYSWIDVRNESLLGVELKEKYSFVFTKGVLIHINPEELPNVYKTIYNASSRYICVIEYYNPKPVDIPYRGFSNRLFKRDFAGEMMDLYSDLEIVKYGFLYHRDKNFPQDDLNWFLLEKKQK